MCCTAARRTSAGVSGDPAAATAQAAGHKQHRPGQHQGGPGRSQHRFGSVRGVLEGFRHEAASVSCPPTASALSRLFSA